MRGFRSLSASKYPQPRLLGQTLIFFDYFWSIEFSSIRATIMSFKVCEVVSAHRLIRARKGLLRGEATITQRSESFQPRFLGQILTLFNYFWSVEFSWISATIMPFKVCEIVSASKSIRAEEDESSWAIESIKSLIFSNAFAASNLRIFREFLKRWSRLDRLYDSCRRKYRARERLVGIRPIWRIDREAYDESTCQDDRRRKKKKLSASYAHLTVENKK